MKYWDSSALVALHIQQSATERIRDLYKQDSSVLTWTLSDVEVRSGIARLGRTGALDPVGVRMAISRVEAFWQSVHEVTLVETVKLRAKRLLSVHSLRAADALQLAAALAGVYDDPRDWEFVCLDRTLCVAASLEGFAVVP